MGKISEAKSKNAVEKKKVTTQQRSLWKYKKDQKCHKIENQYVNQNQSSTHYDNPKKETYKATRSIKNEWRYFNEALTGNDWEHVPL